MRRVLLALKYSIEGLVSAFKDERAFREIIICSIISLICGFIYAKDFMEVAILCLFSILPIITELINSAIENAVDLVTKDKNLYAKKAKDQASAATFIALALLVLIWILKIFIID